MAETQVPDSLDFNKSEVTEANKRKTFAPTGKNGRVQFVITNADRKVSEEKGTLMIPLTCAPLKEEGNPDSKGAPTIRHSVIIPKKNKAFPGHKAPNTVGLCHSFYRAIDPENMPDYPRWDKAEGAYVFEGETLSKEEVEEKRLEVTTAVLERLAQDWKTPGGLIDFAFYGEVYDNNGYANLRNISAELADGCEYVDADNWTKDPDEEDEEDEEEEALVDDEEEEEESDEDEDEDSEEEEEEEEEMPKSKKPAAKKATKPAASKANSKSKPLPKKKK